MKNLFFFLSISFLFLITSCSTSEITSNSVNVYITGTKSEHACYWKNNQLNLLNDVGYAFSSADSIIVVNNDIHILGRGFNSSTKQLYWKNNILTNLTDSFSTPTETVYYITEMDIAGNDVYFAGITTDVSVTPNTYNLVYWKNGVKTIVTSYSTLPFFYKIGSLKVTTNNVFISGPQESSGVFIEGYYENNVFHPFDKLIWGFNAYNSEIYCFGIGLQYPGGYYKNLTNNVETNITANISTITKICFDNGNIYAKDDRNIFKNGNTFYTIPTPSFPFNFYYIGDFYIKNNTTYLLINEDLTSNNYLDQKILINNVVTLQNNPDEIFTSIFVE